MAGPLVARKRIIGAKLEGTPGTAEVITGAECALIVFDPKIVPAVDMQRRERAETFGEWTAIPGAKTGNATFSLELCGSGVALTTTPAWATLFLPCCGMTATANAFAPDVGPIEATNAKTKTCTLGIFQGGKYQVLSGCQGKVTFRFVTSKIIMLDFEFTGLYAEPVDAALPSVTWPTPSPLQFRASTMTINTTWTPRLASVDLMVDNTVEMLEDQAAGQGYCFAAIVNQMFTAKLDPEQSLKATRDVHALWLTPTEVPLSLAVGGTAGNIVTFAAPKLQLFNVQDASRKGLWTDALDGQLNPSTGRDELTITFS